MKVRHVPMQRYHLIYVFSYQLVLPIQVTAIFVCQPDQISVAEIALNLFPLKKQQLDPLLISQIFIPAVKPAAKCLITSLTSQFNVFMNAFIHKLSTTQI